jgi:hypothetical protein
MLALSEKIDRQVTTPRGTGHYCKGDSVSTGQHIVSVLEPTSSLTCSNKPAGQITAAWYQHTDRGRGDYGGHLWAIVNTVIVLN